MTGRICLTAALLALCACQHPPRPARIEARGHIKHVVIIVQENRTFDNIFGGFVQPASDMRYVQKQSLVNQGRAMRPQC